MPSGSTLRVKKTFLNKMLTEDTAKNIGLSSYYPYVRKVFDDILRALDTSFGRPFLMTNATSTSKEAPDDAKPKLDLFRTVIAGTYTASKKSSHPHVSELDLCSNFCHLWEG